MFVDDHKTTESEADRQHEDLENLFDTNIIVGKDLFAFEIFTPVRMQRDVQEDEASSHRYSPVGMHIIDDQQYLAFVFGELMWISVVHG